MSVAGIVRVEAAEVRCIRCMRCICGGCRATMQRTRRREHRQEMFPKLGCVVPGTPYLIRDAEADLPFHGNHFTS